MGSHLTITMLLRSPTILSPLIAIMAARAGPPTWSNLGLLSSQASKRSIEESNESFLAKDLESSASDSLHDTDSYDMDDFKSPEARVESYRRRKKFRLRRRKNRYEPPLVVPEDGELSPNVLYERDSSYNAPSSSYNAPSSSYETPGYSNSYEPPSYESPSYSPSYEAYGGRQSSYRGFGSLPQSNSISKSDSLTANSNIYDYDYYDDDTYEKQDKHDENFLLKALKYLRGDYEMKRIDD